jgi:uncharacterized membrane protein
MTNIKTNSAEEGMSQPVRQSDTLRTLSLVLVVIGLAITAYLSYVKLTNTNAVCLQASGVSCEVVQNSAYSQIMGIPIVYLGLGAYLLLGALLLLENRISLLQEYGIMLVFGITLFAFIYSVWLVYLQFFRLQALCPWCLAHEATMTVLFIVSALRLRKSMAG